MSNQFTDAIIDAIARGWHNFLARPSGPLNFRFLIQPALGVVMAIRVGLKDAREGRPAYLWAAFLNPAQRREIVRGGWKDTRITVFISAILDMTYQVMIHRAVYFLELVFTVALLAVLPYCVLCGPVNRIARPFVRRRAEDKQACRWP